MGDLPMREARQNISSIMTQKQDVLRVLSKRLECSVESLDFIFGHKAEPNFDQSNLAIPDERQYFQKDLS